MGIPKKKSRLTEVSGKKFRYVIRDVRAQEVNPTEDREVVLTVQEDIDRPGRVLQVLLPHGISIVPEMVKKLIEQGLHDGWHPSDRGSAFQLDEYSL